MTESQRQAFKKRERDRLRKYRAKKREPKQPATPEVEQRRAAWRKSQKKSKDKKRLMRMGFRVTSEQAEKGCARWKITDEKRRINAENRYYFYNDMCRFYLLKRIQRYL